MRALSTNNYSRLNSAKPNGWLRKYIVFNAIAAIIANTTLAITLCINRHLNKEALLYIHGIYFWGRGLNVSP